MEGDAPISATLHLSTEEEDIIGHIVENMEKELDTDREAALADMRYQFIEQLCSESVKRNNETKF